jgi:UDP-N-acetylmuramoylalanine--D-glutamate ligase
MKILIVGLGECGKDLVAWLQKIGHEVFVCDDLLKKSPIELPLIDALGDFDLAIHSPGILRTSLWVKKIQEKKIPLVSESEYCVPRLQGRLLGITGTNGKTTTVKLIEHVLSNTKATKAIGNCSPSFAHYLMNPLEDPTLALELSSFQLETMHTPVLDAALILNITQDHLDCYDSMDAYAQSKIRIETLVKEEAPLFIEFNTYHKYRKYFTKQWKTFGFEKKSDYVISKHFLQQVPYHDRLNCFAAGCLLQKEHISPFKIEQLYNTFEKPKHRLEWVDTIDGISFLNDSKATNVDAVKMAIKSCANQRTFLIMGGVDKKQDFSSLAKEFKNQVKHLFVMGACARQLESTFTHVVPLTKVDSLDEAVKKAFSMACPNDIILLSCGSSSYDQFENYIDRGNKFRYTVERIKKGRLE